MPGAGKVKNDRLRQPCNLGHKKEKGVNKIRHFASYASRINQKPTVEQKFACRPLKNINAFSYQITKAFTTKSEQNEHFSTTFSNLKKGDSSVISLSPLYLLATQFDETKNSMITFQFAAAAVVLHF